MRLAVLCLFFLLGLPGCLELLALGNNDSAHRHSGWQWPKDNRTKAQEKFEKAEVVQKLKAKGVHFSCGDVCLEVSDAQIALLNQYADAFANLPPKVEGFELFSGNRILLSDYSRYKMYIHLGATEEDLRLAFDVLGKVLELENLIRIKSYVYGTSQEFLDGLQTLIAHASEVASWELEKLVVTPQPTEYSVHYKVAELNVDTLNESFAKIAKRLELFERVYAKIPKLKFSMYSHNDQAYNLVAAIANFAGEVGELISPLQFHFLISDDGGDSYVSGYSWGSYLVMFPENITWPKFMDVLKYEAYTAHLSRRLRMRVNGLNGFSSYAKYPECMKKLPALENAIFDKQAMLEQIEFDYGIERPATPSSYNQGYLVLNCYEESVEQMLKVIEAIPPRR